MNLGGRAILFKFGRRIRHDISFHGGYRVWWYLRGMHRSGPYDNYGSWPLDPPHIGYSSAWCCFCRHRLPHTRRLHEVAHVGRWWLSDETMVDSFRYRLRGRVWLLAQRVRRACRRAMHKLNGK